MASTRLKLPIRAQERHTERKNEARSDTRETDVFFFFNINVIVGQVLLQEIFFQMRDTFRKYFRTSPRL